MPKYWKYFQESWKDLENRFNEEEFKPEKENDVVCYIYYSLLKRFDKDGSKPLRIKTEYYLEGVGFIDMNIDEKLLIEFRNYKRKKKIGSRLDNKNKEIIILKGIRELSVKLINALQNAKHSSKRIPVIALWNLESKPKEEIPKDILSQLKDLRKELNKKGVRLIFGPRQS